MSIGVWQVILILAIVLIIFGAGKLPRVMGDLAKGVKWIAVASQRIAMPEADQQPRMGGMRATAEFPQQS